MPSKDAIYSMILCLSYRGIPPDVINTYFKKWIKTHRIKPIHPIWLATQEYLLEDASINKFGVMQVTQKMIERSFARGVDMTSPFCGDIQAYRMLMMSRTYICRRIIANVYYNAVGEVTIITSMHECQISKYFEYIDHAKLLVPGNNNIMWKTRNTVVEYDPPRNIYGRFHRTMKLTLNLYPHIWNIKSPNLTFDTPDELYSSCYEPMPHDDSPTEVDTCSWQVRALFENAEIGQDSDSDIELEDLENVVFPIILP